MSSVAKRIANADSQFLGSSLAVVSLAADRFAWKCYNGMSLTRLESNGKPLKNIAALKISTSQQRLGLTATNYKRCATPIPTKTPPPYVLLAAYPIYNINQSGAVSTVQIDTINLKHSLLA